MVLGFFQPSVLGMSNQSHALEVISANIANATTGGYKRSETGFASLLSNSIGFHSAAAGAAPGSVESDLGGVRAYDLSRISEAGESTRTGRALDIAIHGSGFLVMNTAADGSGDTVYGRDGRLAEARGGGAQPGASQGYLVDKTGYFLQGWPVARDGSVNAATAPAAMRVDPDAFAVPGQPTTAARLALNLPGGGAAGGTETYDIDVFDSAGRQQPVTLAFAPSATSPLLWTMSANGSPVGNLAFGSDGRISSPSPIAVKLNFSGTAAAGDETSAAFSLDVSGFTRFDAGLSAYSYERNGTSAAAMTGLRFDDDGTVVGLFDTGSSRPLYRLAIADFTNPDGLGRLAGDVFARTPQSGAAMLAGAGDGGRGAIAGETLEQSNVDLEDEFGRMIMTQKAYNSSATAFRTLDEMAQVASDLRR